MMVDSACTPTKVAFVTMPPLSHLARKTCLCVRDVVDVGCTSGIGGTDAAGSLSYSAPIRVSFWDPANAATRGVTTFVQIRGDQIPIPGNITMRVFDPFGVLLATIVQPDAVGAALTYNGANAHFVEITSTTSTVAFDDLQFGVVTPQNVIPRDPSVVPEPSAVALFGGGALLLGAAARRRRRTM